jgi:hypothetical protein
MSDILDETGYDWQPGELWDLVHSPPTVEQGSEDWFEERLGKATASRFKVIVARDRYDRPYKAYYDYLLQLVVERLTEKRPRFSTKAMEHGVEYESAAADVYEDYTGADVRETGFHEHPKLAAGASPDRLVDVDGTMEIKAPNTSTFIRYLVSFIPDDSPDAWIRRAADVKFEEWKTYFDQIQGQLWIADRKWCDFVVYDPDMPDNAQMIIQRVQRDEEYIRNVLEPRVTGFLAQVDAVENFIRNYNFKEVAP